MISAKTGEEVFPLRGDAVITWEVPSNGTECGPDSIRGEEIHITPLMLRALTETKGTLQNDRVRYRTLSKPRCKKEDKAGRIVEKKLEIASPMPLYL